MRGLGAVALDVGDRVFLQWTLKRLDPEASHALQRLALFQRTLDVQLARVVMDASSVEAMALLAELAKQHLIRPVEGGWRVMAPVRQALPATLDDQDLHAATVSRLVQRLAQDVDIDPGVARSPKGPVPMRHSIENHVHNVRSRALGLFSSMGIERASREVATLVAAPDAPVDSPEASR